MHVRAPPPSIGVRGLHRKLVAGLFAKSTLRRLESSLSDCMFGRIFIILTVIALLSLSFMYTPSPRRLLARGKPPGDGGVVGRVGGVIAPAVH